MKVSELLAQEQATLSLEVFPPKKDTDFASVEAATLGIARLHPSYISVTYGAGGSTKAGTIQLASEIQKKYSVPAISHLTCVCASKDSIQSALTEMKQAGIAYATDQIIDLLANGVRHIHVYSMNKPEIAEGIQTNLSEILKA